MTTTNNDILQNIQLGTDISLKINFSEKIIEVVSENWTVIARRNDLRPLSIQAQQQQQQQQEKEERDREIANSISQKTRSIVERAKEFKKQDGYIPDKKVQLSKSEIMENKRLNKFVQVFGDLLPLEALDQVHYKKLKDEAVRRKIINDNNREFNNLLNLAISQDIIEESNQDAGYYRIKKEDNKNA